MSKLALYVGLNRSYLTTVFQNTLHVSPQQFLMRFRMERASQLLLEGTLSVGEVAVPAATPIPSPSPRHSSAPLASRPPSTSAAKPPLAWSASSVDTGGR